MAPRARKALVDIFTSEQADDDSIPIRLLADIKGCFTGEKMSSSDLSGSPPSP